MMHTMKQADVYAPHSNKEDLLRGLDLLTAQLHTIDQQLIDTVNKEVQRQVQYQRQHIMHVQNTLLSCSSPLSLD